MLWFPALAAQEIVDLASASKSSGSGRESNIEHSYFGEKYISNIINRPGVAGAALHYTFIID